MAENIVKHLPSELYRILPTNRNTPPSVCTQIKAKHKWKHLAAVLFGGNCFIKQAVGNAFSQRTGKSQQSFDNLGGAMTIHPCDFSPRPDGESSARHSPDLMIFIRL